MKVSGNAAKQQYMSIVACGLEKKYNVKYIPDARNREKILGVASTVVEAVMAVHVAAVNLRLEPTSSLVSNAVFFFPSKINSNRPPAQLKNIQSRMPVRMKVKTGQRKRNFPYFSPPAFFLAF